ncbi:MAG TPA: preprotein translocase subunit YajC [Coriobacteriia bacterium]|nr:preprotein translocase subunit YajC [Coriobacteriia bacterium]
MGAQFSNIVFIVLLVAVFWFVAIRPQQQRQKQQRAMLSALAPGDEIITAGGIYATVVAAGERVRIRVADGTEFEISPAAVGQVLPATEFGADAEDDEADAGSVAEDDEAPTDA